MRRSVAVGLGVAAVVGTAVALASRRPTLMPWPTPVRRVFPAVVGGLVGGTTGVTTGMVAALVERRYPRWQGMVATLGVGAGIVGTGYVAGTRARRMIEDRNRQPDPALAGGPAAATVSGSPSSLVSMSELGREGVRFVSFATEAADITAVQGRPAASAPIRIFIGFDAAAEIEQRVALAMAELRRTGAFERSVILVQAPAGTGYANSTPVDALELLTGGDCATVVVSFGLLPSFLSMRQVPQAARAQRLLLDAIAAELATRARAPRVLLYGESLGASIQQAAVPAGPTDLDAFGISGVLWVGTPGGQLSDAIHARCEAEAIVLDRAEDIPDRLPVPRPRVWFLEHIGDPVVRFRPALLLSRPAWLPTSGPRGRGVPDGMAFRPLITYLQVLVDTLFATDVEPGTFASAGHDYRADLGAAVLGAFDLTPPPVEGVVLNEVLAALEARRAASFA